MIKLDACLCHVKQMIQYEVPNSIKMNKIHSHILTLAWRQRFENMCKMCYKTKSIEEKRNRGEKNNKNCNKTIKLCRKSFRRNLLDLGVSKTKKEGKE